MSRHWAALLLLALNACDEPAPSSGKATAKGVSACRDESFEGKTFTHCLADPERHSISMVLAPKGGIPYRGFAALVTADPGRVRRIAFAMNGGMYGEDGRPIGYYVEDGKRGHTLNRGRGGGNFHLLPNGVFHGTEGTWAVRETAAFAKSVSKRPQFGTQSGPMLVIDGKLHPRFSKDGDSRFVRNAVGVDRQGRAHFVISENAVSFGRLARYFRDRLKTPNALFLDGNVSALWDPASGRMDETVPIGPMIVVEKRAVTGTD